MTIPYSHEQVAGYKSDNERRVREAALKGDVFVDGMPLKVTMELTADCDLFCKMCEFVVPRERGRKRGYDLHMDKQVFRMLADQVFPHARLVNLTVVGEPFLVPYMDEVLERAGDWQARIEFITHGMHLDRRTIEKVGPYTGTVIVSFDGGTRRTFNRIRVGSDFDVVTRNMLRFDRWRKSRPPGAYQPGLHMGVTLMKENIEELPTIIRIAHLLGVDQVNAALMIAFSEKMARSSLFRHKALANACLLRAREVADELGVVANLPALFKGVSPAEQAAVEIAEPELPDGPLPHLAAELSGTGEVADEGGGVRRFDAGEVEILLAEQEKRIPESSGLDHATPSMGATLEAVEEDGSTPDYTGYTEAPGTDERAPLDQSTEERRLQAQVLADGVPMGDYRPAEPPDEGEDRYACKFLWNELFVALNGDVTPCCIQGRPVVGNIHKDNLSEIWNGPIMQRMRRGLLEGDPMECCRDCNYNTQLGKGEYREDTFLMSKEREV